MQRDDTAATVVVSGELDLATVPRLWAAVAEHRDAKLLVLDLTAVTFIDSAGARVLIEADRSCAGSSSHVVVLAGGPVRRVLNLCNLDGRLRLLVTDDPSRAVQCAGPAQCSQDGAAAEADRTRRLTR